MGKEFGLVGCHVDINRAVALAALACQAQVQRVANCLGSPAIRDGAATRVAIEHLEQQPSPAPRGVLFLSCHHVGGAHHAAAFAATLADTDATQYRATEVTVI